MRPWPSAAVSLLLLASTAAARAQPTDPRSSFVRSLESFSRAIEGTYGDEGPRIVADLDALDGAVADWDQSIRDYEAETERHLPSAPDGAAKMHIALGGLYLDRARLADAIREFDAAIAIDGNRPDPFVLRGLATAAAGDIHGAAASFRRAAELDAGDPAHKYLLARALLAEGRLDEARAAFRALTSSLPPATADRAAARPFMHFGLIEERSGVEPYFPPAAYAEGFARLEQGDLARAAAMLRRATSTDPLVADDVARSYGLRRATAAFRDGDLATAAEQLQAAIEIYPSNSELHRLLGLVLAAGDQYERAATELKSAVAANPVNERARLALADVLTTAERPADAEQVLRDAIVAIPASGRARYALARLCARQGRVPEALEELQRALRPGPLLGVNGIYQAMGAMAASRQNFDTALEAYSRRVDIQPNAPDAHQDLGDTYARLGRDDEALAEFAIATILDPRRAAAPAAVAQLRLRNGRYEEAADAARRAIALDARHTQAHYTLATALIRLGRTEEGQRELDVFQHLQDETAASRERAVELGALRREASMSSANGDHQKAVTLLRRALAIAPDDMVSHLNLGIALMLAGQPAEAADRFTSALALGGPIEIHSRLAQAYSQLGRADDSRRELELYNQLKQAQLRQSGAGR